MLQGGDCINARFYAPDNPSDLCGTLRIEYAPGPFDSTNICTLPFRCYKQPTVRQIISQLIKDGMSRYNCGDDARNYIWWCSLALYRLAGAGYVTESAAIDFRAFIEELRSTREDLRAQIPEVITEGWPIRQSVAVADDELYLWPPPQNTADSSGSQ